MKTIIAPLSLIAFLGLFYWPIVRWLIQSWLSNPYYSHGFLIPLVSGFIVWKKRDVFKGVKPSNVGALVLALGLFVYVMGFVWGMRSLSAFSFLIMLGGLVLYFWGIKATRSMIFPLGFLIFMIPLPFLDHVAYRLQSLSVDYSTSLLQTIGIAVTTGSNEIHIGGSTFTIGLPCSGMKTLIALLALATVYAYLLKGPVYKRTIVFIAAFPIAIVANILRISSIILVANYRGTEAATGFFHDFSSVLLFLIACLGLVLFSRLLGCRLRVPVEAR